MSDEVITANGEVQICCDNVFGCKIEQLLIGKELYVYNIVLSTYISIPIVDVFDWQIDYFVD